MAEEQIAQAESYKEQGNRFHTEGNYKKALGAYHKVFCYVNGLQAPPADSVAAGGASGSRYIPKERAEDVRKLQQSTRLNMAACYLKLGEHQKCVDACTAALDFGSSSKAFFRRGKARCELRDFGGARADLERARELAPEDPAIPAELRRVRAAFEHGDAAERRQCAKMFPEAAAAAPADAAPADADAAADAAAPASTDASVEVAAPSRDEAVPPPAQAAATSSTAPPPAGVVTPLNLQGADEVRKLDFAVRELKYAWQQTDEDVKIYVAFDQSEELQGGVDESAVEVEFGEWNMLLLIRSSVDGRPPFGLRLGDFHRRVAPDLCRCTVRGSRITVKLMKQAKEHWWSLLQSTPLHAE